jgi:lactoylglutathione lyase
MFSSYLKIIMYVKNLSATIDFWTSFGFAEKTREMVDGTEVVQITPVDNEDLVFELYDAKFMEENGEEVNTASPTLMFHSRDVEDLYKKMQTKNVPLGDLIKIGEAFVFNFTDPDGNFFVVSSEK